jgi:hypothetical protein
MKQLLISILFGFILVNCDRLTETQDSLPTATQVGANTFGCKLNGVVFVPNKAIGSTVVERPLKVFGYYSNSQNSSSKIVAWRGQDVRNLLYIDVYIYQIDLIGKAVYNLGKAPEFDDSPPFHSYIKCRAVSPITKQYKYYGSYENSGNIDVTYLSADKLIMSGKFTGKLREINGTEEVEVTDGRFDINLKTL